MNPPGWQQSRNDHPAVLYRRVLAAILGEPAAGSVVQTGDLAVAAGGGMSVNVAAGAAHVKATGGVRRGMYHVVNDATTNVPIATANATNPRFDLVALRVRDTEHGHNASDGALVVIPGTAAPAPVEPTVPTDGHYLVLARVTVGAGVTSINSGNLVDRRTVSPSLASVVTHDHRADGTQGAPTPSVRVRRALSAQSLPNGFATISWDTTDHEIGGDLWAAGQPTRLVAPVAGVYRVSATASFAGSTGGLSRGVQLLKNGTLVPGSFRTIPNISNTGRIPAATVTADLLLAAGDFITVQAYQDTGANLDSGPSASGAEPDASMTLVARA